MEASADTKGSRGGADRSQCVPDASYRPCPPGRSSGGTCSWALRLRCMAT